MMLYNLLKIRLISISPIQNIYPEKTALKPEMNHTGFRAVLFIFLF